MITHTRGRIHKGVRMPQTTKASAFRSCYGRAICLALSLLFLLPLSAKAEKLTIDAIFGTTSLTGRTPRGVKISPDGKRVGFLRGREDDQYQLDLWVYDVKDHRMWRVIDSKALLPEENLTDSEKARRERERTAAMHGILSYEWAPDGRRVLFHLGDVLYLYDLTKYPESAFRKITDGRGIIDPKVSPKGRYVSWVRDQNLYVMDLASGTVRQLTSDGGGTLHNAEAEFIAQEEMDESSGYWWAPNDSLIAYKQFDESPVPVVRRFEVYSDRTDVVEERYPGAGDSNVVVHLGVISPTGGETRWIDLGPDIDIYLARVDWMPDGHTVTYQRQTRDQKHLDLVAVNAATLTQKILLTEQSNTWVNLNRDLHFLKRQSAFIWGSERTGYHHLYLYGDDGELIRPLTGGTWTIDGLQAVDEATGLVYFTSNRDVVIDRQVYTARLDGDPTQTPVRISSGDGWHTAIFADAADEVALYVESFSDPVTPSQTSIRGPGGRFLSWIEENKLDENHPFWKYREALVTPEYGTLTADDGQLLEYEICKPADLDPARRYPVVISVYGGPGGQTARRGWPSLFDLCLVQEGYIVFTLDNRGSARRGRKFADALYHRMGDVEVRDQLVGIQWLKKQPYVDTAHIGVFGWSYGGYMAVMMLAKASDQLAAGVAGAPVTDWRVYDTHYTEHYLGTPQENAAGYDSSAVFGVLGGLTSPLLLLHGMADDNVLFANTTLLMTALQTQGTQFTLMTYPGGKHGLSTPAMKKHAYHLISDFFKEKLQPGMTN